MRKFAEKKITANNSQEMTGSLNLLSAHGHSDGFPKRERLRVYAHRASASAAASSWFPIGIHCDAWVDAWNGSGTDFQASQCIPMDPASDAAAAARCAYTLSVSKHFV